MGIDTKTLLPHYVRIGDVASVIGVAAGCDAEFSRFSDGVGGYAKVSDTKFTTHDWCPSMVNIVLKKDVPHESRMCYFHYETSVKDRVLISARSTEFWIAVSKRLVDFFGGEADFNDCDDIDADYTKSCKPYDIICPESGEPWMKHQKAILAVKRIHISEMPSLVEKNGTYTDGNYNYRFDENGLMVR